MRALTICLALAAAMTHPAAAQAIESNADKGKEIAELWCSSCHLVSADQASATTEAPPFATIAKRSANELGWLPAFLADPHPPMPKFSLTREEIRNLVAYFAALKEAE